MIEIKGVIYKIKNKLNDKVYIGQTVQEGGFDSRYRDNLEKYTTNRHLKNSINKYGIENFEINKELDIASSQEELNNKEIYWIDYYKSTNPKYGYNKREGGEGGLLNDESKIKISETKQANRELIVEKLLTKMKNEGRNKFYAFDISNYDNYRYINIPLDLVVDCDDKTDMLELCVICYLSINTNRIGYSLFNLKDMIDKCGFESSSSRIINQFKEALLDLQGYKYIDTEANISSIKLNSIMRIRLTIDIENREFICCDALTINKLMGLHMVKCTSKILRLYLYLVYLANNPHNIINGIININETLGIHKETIFKYLNILTENQLIYYCDLGYIRTSMGTIRGGTCYATDKESLEVIKKNAEYIII